MNSKNGIFEIIYDKEESLVQTVGLLIKLRFYLMDK